MWIFDFIHQTVNEMNGKHSGCMMWPGSDFQYQNVSCTFTHLFNTTESLNDRMDLALSWFQAKTKPANLVMVYIEEPDRHGHAFSPDSDVVNSYLLYIFFFSCIFKYSDARKSQYTQNLKECWFAKRIQSILCKSNWIIA